MKKISCEVHFLATKHISWALLFWQKNFTVSSAKATVLEINSKVFSYLLKCRKFLYNRAYLKRPLGSFHKRALLMKRFPGLLGILWALWWPHFSFNTFNVQTGAFCASTVSSGLWKTFLKFFWSVGFTKKPAESH